VPFCLSAALSLSTVGPHPYWQDSGFYLAAVRDLGVLYPPGFCLYLLLCRLWTLLFFFLDFTLSVHLFSSLCSAVAAAAMGVAVRDFLRSRGSLFKVHESDPGAPADLAGIVAGSILASGFTFWSAGIYAKGYSLLFAVLALLLWRMIRADESGRPRDLTWVAVLIGTSWQVHPSAALAGAAFLAFTAAHARALGAGGIAVRVGIAAACALGPTLILLPLFRARDPWIQMEHPDGAVPFLRYLAGMHYLGLRDVFGYEASRISSFGQYLWEEWLGVGLGFATVGLGFLALRRRRLLGWLVLWTLPYVVVTLGFKIEGQHDYWFVAAWMPFILVLGLGVCTTARLLRPRGLLLAGGAGTLSVIWAVAANARDLSRRHEELPLTFGRTILGTVDPRGILVMAGDDALALLAYLQRVRGERPDVTVVSDAQLFRRSLGAPSDGYEEMLLRKDPSLKRPDYLAAAARFPHARVLDASTAGFLNANADAGRPLFCHRALPKELIRPDLRMVPAGGLWKVVPSSASAAAVDDRYWRVPVEPETVRSLFRRERGQFVHMSEEGMRVRPESYEARFVNYLLKARIGLAFKRVEQGAYPDVVRLLESVLALDPSAGTNMDLVHCLGHSYLSLGAYDRAEPLLRTASSPGNRPELRATALFSLGELARTRGDPEGARRLESAALAVPGLDAAFRSTLERRMKSR
jgi:hypothetical protein